MAIRDSARRGPSEKPATRRRHDRAPSVQITGRFLHKTVAADEVSWLNQVPPAQRRVLQQGVGMVLSSCRTSEDFAAAETLSKLFETHVLKGALAPGAGEGSGRPHHEVLSRHTSRLYEAVAILELCSDALTQTGGSLEVDEGGRLMSAIDGALNMLRPIPIDLAEVLLRMPIVEQSLRAEAGQ